MRFRWRKGVGNTILVALVLALALAAVLGFMATSTQGDVLSFMIESDDQIDTTVDDQSTGLKDTIEQGIKEGLENGGPTMGDSSGSQTSSSSDASSGDATTAAPEGSYKIREGTDEETTVYVIEAETEGPTIMVIGGMHGNEHSGFRAAKKVKDWNIDAGTLVVLPEANRVAIKNDERTWSEGDLNRHFPSGNEPTSELAKAIWGVVKKHEPDFLLDLHSSRGLWDRSMSHSCGAEDGNIPESVGMSLFHTQAGGADVRSKTREVRDYLNNNHYPSSLPDAWTFTAVGSGGDGSKPMLKHKVAADLGTPAVIFETFDKRESCVDIEQQVEWATATTHKFLELYGVKK